MNKKLFSGIRPTWYKNLSREVKSAVTIRKVVEIQNAVIDANVEFCKVGDARSCRWCGILLDEIADRKREIIEQRKGVL